MAFCWVTTRHRLVGLGYGWLLRGIYLVLATGAARGRAALRIDPACARRLAGDRRRPADSRSPCRCIRQAAGVSGANAEHERRTARVAAMTGIDREPSPQQLAAAPRAAAEFPPCSTSFRSRSARSGSSAAALDAAGRRWQRRGRPAAHPRRRRLPRLRHRRHAARPLVPRAARAAARLLNELVTLLGWIWPLEVAVLLLPDRHGSVWSRRRRRRLERHARLVLGGVRGHDDRARVRHPRRAQGAHYSAVMAATGLLYLAILTAFGTDLVARAVLAG